MRTSYAIIPFLLLACSSTSAGNPASGDGDADAGGDAARDRADASSSSEGAPPAVAVTRGCTTDDEIRYSDYGSKGSLVGTWDLTKACAPNLLAAWNDTKHPANKLVSVSGTASA